MPWVLCHVSFVLFLSLLCVDVRVMCSHARCHVYGYALLRSMCSYAFCHVLCLDPHPYMLICLDLCVHMFVCLGLDYVCHAMCYCSPFVALSFFLAFWPNGSDII